MPLKNDLRELYAIEQIVKRLTNGDTLYQEARERLDDAKQRFIKALSGAYNRLYFPGKDENTGEDVLLMVTIDNGLKVGTGDQSAKKQIEELLASPPIINWLWTSKMISIIILPKPKFTSGRNVTVVRPGKMS